MGIPDALGGTMMSNIQGPFENQSAQISTKLSLKVGGVDAPLLKLKEVTKYLFTVAGLQYVCNVQFVVLGRSNILFLLFQKICLNIHILSDILFAHCI